MTAEPARATAPAGLDEREAAALDAVLAAILPSTSGPGAAEADAGAYVRRRLAGPDRGWLDPLRQWLVSAVVAAPAAGSDAVERAAGAVAALAADDDGPGAALFEQLRLWAWSGYLGDPAHGGNAGGVGWRRFDWSPPAGRAAGAPPRATP